MKKQININSATKQELRKYIRNNVNYVNSTLTDIEKADKELGVRPVYSAEEAIVITTKWYKAFYEGKENMRSYTAQQIADFVTTAQAKNIEWSL